MEVATVVNSDDAINTKSLSIRYFYLSITFYLKEDLKVGYEKKIKASLKRY